MAKAKFGTDGIRGKAGEGALTADILRAIAASAGRHMRSTSKARRCVIGRDTRLSGPEIQDALTEGLISAGIDVTHIGVVPTPALAMSIDHVGADFGVMITASHNPWHDNGIKFFKSGGTKLSRDEEIAIEEGLDAPHSDIKPGSILSRDDAGGAYVAALTAGFKAADLSGLKIVLDCANGAAFETAPAALRALGATSLTVIGNTPDGRNINRDCGSTHTQVLSQAVVKSGADIGVALDGDADRLIMVDEQGRAVDGDQLLGFMARAAHADGTLKGAGIVATVMSNLGLERFLSGQGLTLDRTPVGDKHVAARMREAGFNIGGEQSGHLLLTDYGPTGDGTLAAIAVLAQIAAMNTPASEALRVFTPVPQKLVNVRYAGKSPMENAGFMAAIAKADTQMGEGGRILVRASGTEPLIRIMAEGDDSTLVDLLTEQLADFINTPVKG